MVVEELVGKLSLRASGISDAKKATKAVNDFRAALKGLAGVARVNLNGPANAARAFKQLSAEAKRAEAAQKGLAAGSGMARADAAVRKHTSLVKELGATYRDVARSQALLAKRPSGKSLMQGELDALRNYRREMRAVMKEAGRMGVPSGRAERHARLPYGAPHGELHHRGREAVRSVGDAVSDTGTERARQELAGLEPEERTRLRKKSLELSTQYPSLGQTEIEEMGRAARNAAPNFDMAMQLLDKMAQFQVSQQASRGIEAASGQLGQLIKAMDNMGRLDSIKEATDLLEGINKATNVEGKELNPASLYTMARKAKSAGATLSAEYLSTDAQTLAQDMGPSELGTALGTMLSQMVGGRATNASKRTLEDAGLAEWGLKGVSAKEAKRRRALGIKGKGTNNIPLLLSNPTQWAEENMIPAMAQMGIDSEDNTAVSKYMSEAFSAQTVANFWTKTITQMAQLKRNRKMYGKAPDLKQSTDIAKKDPKVSEEAAKQSTLNIARQVADKYNAAKTTALSGYTDLANSAANFIAEDPETRGLAAGGAVGVGALLMKALKGRGLLKFGQSLARGTASAATTGGATTAAAGAGATEAGVAAATTAAGASAALIGTTIGTAAGAAFAAYATTKQLPKVAENGGPGAIDPATGEHLGSGRPETSPWLTEWLRSKMGSGAAAGGTKSLEAVDTKLAEMKTNAVDMAEKMKESLSFTAKPEVDTSSIKSALALAQQLKATLDGAKASGISGAAKGSEGILASRLQINSNGFTTGPTSP